VFLIGDGHFPLRRHEAEQLARELDRVTLVGSSSPLPHLRSAAVLIRDALDSRKSVVELEDNEVRAIAGFLDTGVVPLNGELIRLRQGIESALGPAEA